MFSSLLADHIAREIARSGGIGLAQSVAAQLDAYRR
jgi:Rod binding domain-containing protein